MREKTFFLFTLLWSCSSSDEYVFPRFHLSSEPSDLVLQGSSASLRCAAVGQPKPVIRWSKEGAELSEGGEELQLRGVAADAGTYQCSASLPGVGTLVSRVASVTYSGRPEFLKSPSSLTVFLGQTALFACSLAPSTIQVSWLKNDRPVRPDGIRIRQLPSGSLEIVDVNINDKGNYRCSGGGSESPKAELRINMDIASRHQPAPPTFISLPAATKVLVGEPVFLECAANGVPSPSISWLKDGVNLDLDSGTRYSITGNGSLTINQAELGDEGGYQCRAENTEDVVDLGLEVEVLQPPAFTATPANQQAYQKDDILLECGITGHPRPSVQWFKNGDVIIESEYFQIVAEDSLKILGLVTSDAGVYQCLASNKAGSIQASAILHVLEKGGSGRGGGAPTTRPLSLLGSGLLAGVPGPPANLQAVITSTRFITLAWEPPVTVTQGSPITGYSVFYQQQDSERERIVNSTRGTLEELSIQGLQPGTSYLVRVLAHNEHGPGQSSPVLEISTQMEVDLPASPVGLTATPISSFSILVNWTPPPGQIDKYRLYYRQGEFSDERQVELTGLQYHLSDLREFTEYTFWISAFNSNGEGAYSEEVACRTYSDIPADPPQNVTLEPASSSSIIVRWEPPPRESQNGILTGYKLKWRRAGKGSAQTVSTDGSRRLFAITGLRKGREYQVKMTALTVNGTGPYTGWLTATTFTSDLDESVVPEPPASLKAKASDNSITIAWNPPSSKNILVRGYTIGWGKGIPDEYTKVVDNKQRYFVIDNLKSNSEYVISLRAYNNVGDGRPIYETTRTQDESAREPSTPLVPPLGLHAIVLSSSTVVLTWMDSTLPRNQLITDNRYYIVRYTSVVSIAADRPKHNYRNATDLNAMIDDLRPNNEYEFTVKVVKGRRQSPWSLVVLNTTQEAAPSSPPRDLNVLAAAGGSDAITLTWLPPRRTNGRINGYVVFYTVDKRKQDREWVVEGVVGDKTSTEIRSLDPDTKYYFKIQARNSKGYGPHSPVTVFRTRSSGGGLSAGNNAQVLQAGIPPVVQYSIFAAGGVIVIVAVIFGLVMCRRGSRAAAAAEERNKPYMKGESGPTREKLNPPPPDLWINHDQLELKSMDSNHEEGRQPSLPRSTPIDVRGSTSTLDRSRYIQPYSGTESERSYCLGGGGRESQRRLIRPSACSNALGTAAGGGRPMKIAAIGNRPQRYLSKESVASSIPSTSCASSTYIRSQYTLNPPPPSSCRSITESAHSPDPLPGYPGPDFRGSDMQGPGSEGPGSTCNGDFAWGANTTASSIDGGGSALSCGGYHPSQIPQYMSSAMSTSSGESGSVSGSGSRACSGSGGSAAGSGSGSRRPSHLRSFNIPTPPSSLAQQKQGFVRPNPTSPFKRVLSSTSEEPMMQSMGSSSTNLNLPVTMGEVRSPDILHSATNHPCHCINQSNLMPSHSEEELNSEMRNLESVMKDLNAITGHNQPLPPHPLHIPCPNKC